MTARPTALRVEHLSEQGVVLGERRPRLSWQLPEGSARQHAYVVEVDDEPTGEVRSGESLLRPWPAAPLSSRRRVSWRVKVWTDQGESAWSEPSRFEIGLLEASDWAASWVEPVEAERAPAVLRHEFTLASAPATARMYATAHGVYETYLNGARVGDVELAPGFTDYPTTLHVQAYDVASLLVPGRNTWEVVLSDGWWRGPTGFMQIPNGYGDALAFLGQLEADGQVVVTDGTWTASTGPIVSADLMTGQVEDRRRSPEQWTPVRTSDHGFDALGWSPAPPVRRIETLRPVSVTPVGEDRQVVDFGQNIHGWVRLEGLGPSGTTTRLVHGEALDGSGDVTQENLVGLDIRTGGPLQVDQTDVVTSSGAPGDVFEPRHTSHGFQFVRVEGRPGALTADDVAAVVVHTDLTRTGSFTCSDERINRLHEICEWSFRGNASDIPTDCPHRERSGFTGDWQVFFPSAACMYDVAGFTRKWLDDVASTQFDDGCIPNIAPEPMRWMDPIPEQWRHHQGSAGWGDAIVLVPWEMWRTYGDVEVLASMWPAMAAWVDYAAGMARSRRHPSRADRRPEPAPHEQYLWDTGFHWGEWLEPGGAGRPDLDADHAVVATAFLHQSAKRLAQIAALLDRPERAGLEALAAATREAWQTEFVGPDGALTPDTQATHVRALAFDLVPERLRPQVARRLVELIREAGGHLGTGFLATPYLLPVLADAGHADTAFELLLQDSPPSWLHMVDRGATTVWENWDGVDDAGKPEGSLNHYSKGSVLYFLHRYVAGIQLLEDVPAYRRFRVAPHVGGGLTSARAVHESPYGRVVSAWRVDGDRCELEVTVPAGTTAEVVLPGQQPVEQAPGTAVYGFPAPARGR